MSKMQREKGARAERQVVSRAKDFGFDARRTAPMQAAGPGDADVTLGLAHVYLEVKHQETLRIAEWSRKAEHEAGDRLPAVAYRTNKEPWRVSMPMDDFFDLLMAATS